MFAMNYHSKLIFNPRGSFARIFKSLGLNNKNNNFKIVDQIQFYFILFKNEKNLQTRDK